VQIEPLYDICLDVEEHVAVTSLEWSLKGPPVLIAGLSDGI
jgi:hypothetical protein